MRARTSLRLQAAALGLAASAGLPGCAPLGAESPEPEGERLGQSAAALTVAEAAAAGCTTATVAGLSLQIIAQGDCSSPGAYVAVPALPNVSFGGAVLPYLEAPARDAFVAAAAAEPQLSMQVNSMLRTVAQQYLLYSWYLAGSCGIGLAATPGSSNHETGLALDLSPYDLWRPTLEAHGFAWLGASDPVHFDYVGAGAVDYRGVDVRAFQELWNGNHPDDPIAADGDYGPQTEARLELAPADGFAHGADCSFHPGISVGEGTGGAPGLLPGGAASGTDPEGDASASAGCAFGAGAPGTGPSLGTLLALVAWGWRRTAARPASRRRAPRRSRA
ncbi:MAG: D-alanyl-D-alanine carboxypeptidase family protein [Myxococcales bacterium]|nr:D-alanyl-D-alanine carboxypeptidase family protein [Myxococcales bacterium]